MSVLIVEQVFAPAAQLLKHSAALSSFFLSNLLPIWLGLLGLSWLAKMSTPFALQSFAPFLALFVGSPWRLVSSLQSGVGSRLHVMLTLEISG